MSSRPRQPIWSRIVGVLAFLAAIGMIVWAILDAANGKGVSEVVIDVFIAIVLGGIAATLLGLWRGGRGSGNTIAKRTAGDQSEDSPRR